MRYPPPSADEIPEIEPKAVIDDGSGANDVASGEAAHDHVVSPSGPGSGAIAPGGPPTQRWKCTSSSSLRVMKSTVPVARMKVLVTADGRDTQGGAVPAPPSAGAGGSAMPARKMFELPGTSIVEAASHRDGSIVEGAVLGRARVWGTERGEHPPIAPDAPRMARSR